MQETYLSFGYDEGLRKDEEIEGYIRALQKNTDDLHQSSSEKTYSWVGVIAERF